MRYLSLVLMLAIGLFVMGCGGEEPDTPAEGLKKGVQDAGDAMQDAGDEVQDAAEDAADKAQDAAGALNDAADAAVTAVTCSLDGCTAPVNASVEVVDGHGFCCGSCRTKFVKANQ